MIVLIGRSIGWADLSGDTVSCMVKTLSVIQPKHLVTALLLMLTEQVKRLVALNQIRLAFVLERLQTFQRWITRANDDQP
jgi:hypothetical protein